MEQRPYSEFLAMGCGFGTLVVAYFSMSLQVISFNLVWNYNKIIWRPNMMQCQIVELIDYSLFQHNLEILG